MSETTDSVCGFPTYKPYCFGCKEPLLTENAWMSDGCPCNSKPGCNTINGTRWRLLRDLQQQQSDALAAATKRADEAEAKLRWEELRRSVDASLQSWQVSQSLEAIWYIDAYRRVLNCMDRLAPAWKERTVSNVDNQALVDALVKFQRWSDAGGLDYEEQIQGCRDLIATQRTRIAEVEQERDQYKASANVGAEFFHDIGKILAPEGERKSFTDADVKQWAAEAKTAEQENARLREALADLSDCCLSLILQPGNRGYECDAREAMQRCDALLAHSEGGSDD